MKKKSNLGGKRAGAGRPVGPHGKKHDKNIAMTTDVWSFLHQSGAGKAVSSGVFLEWFIRRSAAFRNWQKRQSDGKAET
jgi:hypothetical protein